MLVISRKENQSIDFPGLGISVKFSRISGSTVRVGIDAPRDIRVLRGELVREQSIDSDDRRCDATASTDHQLNNQLSEARLALKLIQMQLAAGREEDAMATAEHGLRSLNEKASFTSQETIAAETTSGPKNTGQMDRRRQRPAASMKRLQSGYPDFNQAMSGSAG